MIVLRKPSEKRIERFLDNQRSLPFSYPEVGASQKGAPPGYPVNHHHGRLGTGHQTFARAVEAIRGWKMYETGWTKLCWPEAPITEGAIVPWSTGSWRARSPTCGSSARSHATPSLVQCELGFTRHRGLSFSEGRLGCTVLGGHG